MMPEDTTPESFSPEILAAYADGELEAGTHAAVERWLADNPEARASLNTQREFGPGNADLWQRAEIPAPSAASWAIVRHGIESGLNPPTPKPAIRYRSALWVLGGIATIAVAASVAWVVFGPVAQQRTLEDLRKPREIAKSRPEIAPPPRQIVTLLKPDPLAGFAVLEMATDEEVVLDRVPDTRTGWLPIGRHPLPDTLALASVDEVHLQEVDLSPVWPVGPPKMTKAPGHAPMIFAAKPR